MARWLPLNVFCDAANAITAEKRQKLFNSWHEKTSTTNSVNLLMCSEKRARLHVAFCAREIMAKTKRVQT